MGTEMNVGGLQCWWTLTACFLDTPRTHPSLRPGTCFSLKWLQ